MCGSSRTLYFNGGSSPDVLDVYKRQGIVNDSMTQRQKAEAIYAWVRGNLRYSGHSATRDWGEEAYQGFRRRHGDCFTYFSVSVALLSKAGIDSIEAVSYTHLDVYKRQDDRSGQ